MPKKTPKLLVFVTLIIVILIVLVIFFIARPKESLPPVVAIDTTGQPMLGNPKAKIHIVAFEDLKCGNCKLFNNSLFPKVKEKYIDTQIANYRFINLAFIPGSLPAANAARCLYVQNKKFFFPFVEYIYHHQPDESQDWATVGTLIEFAKASVPKANLDDLSNCIIESRYNNFIENNLKMAAKIMKGAVATPAIYVNGRKIEKFNIENFDQLVEAAK